MTICNQIKSNHITNYFCHLSQVVHSPPQIIKVVQPVAVQAPAPIIKFVQVPAPAPQPQIIHVVQHQQQQQQPQVRIIKIVQDNAQSAGWAEPPQAQHVKIIKIVNDAPHHQPSW